MISENPKPLQQGRLKQLVHGLRTRMSGGLESAAAQVKTLRQEIQELESKLSEDVVQCKESYRQNKADTITAWDEELHSCWDEAERNTYLAIFETAEKEKRFKAEAKSHADKTTQDAQKRIHEVDAKFMRAKERPIQILRKFRVANDGLKEQLSLLQDRAESALAQRSLSIPKLDAEPEAPAYDQPADSKTAFQLLKDNVEEAKQQAYKITNNRLAAFVDSIFFWGFCFLFFGATLAVLVGTQTQELLPATISAGGASVGFILFAFLGIRPWLKKSAKREFPILVGLVKRGEHIHASADRLAVQENEKELAALASVRDQQFENVKKWREERLEAIQREYEKVVGELRAAARKTKHDARENLTGSVHRTDDHFHQRITSDRRQRDESLQRLKDSTQAHCDQIRDTINEIDSGGAERLRIATQKAVTLVGRSRAYCRKHFPDWSSIDGETGNWPELIQEPHLPLGDLVVQSALPDVERISLDEYQLQAPVLFSPLDDGYLVIHGKPTHHAVRSLIRCVLLRALTTLPAGRTQVCIMDPPGLGQDFGWLMHLGDFDSQLVTHRVWTQVSHIGRQLSTLALSAEDFIQQALRNEFSNIVEYNQEAGALAEPYRFLVWSSMPNGMDDQGWKNLKSLLDSGARCGIIPILIVDPAESWPYEDQRAAVLRNGLHLELVDKSQFRIRASSEPQLTIHAPEAPDDARAQEIVKSVGKRALLSNRVEVPLERMLPAREGRWQADSSRSLEIPIGQSGVGRTHCLELGIGTAQHAIIAGKTGSGKSSLLHALITSAMMKYSPETLRLVLLDFKKGVEFQVYSDSQVPHADIIGIESHREFGLSALEYVDGCLQRRGEMFRSAGVQDIASWNALHPEQILPRMLVVVDEFQEIFVEDDKLSSQASLILDRIVRQGRSFGVHAILSSQTLAGSYSLPRTTLGQMAVRIALQCDPSDAQIIFAEDNPAAARLKHPGQAVYNDAGGRIEGNQPMQIGWLPKEQQIAWFQEQEQGYRNGDESTNLLGRTVVYDGNRAATWSDVNANMAIQQAKSQVNPDAVWCVAGESVAINPAVVYPLTRQSGRNMLLVGGDDAQAAATIHSAVSSFTKATANTSAKVFAIQGAKPTDSKALTLGKLWQDFSGDVQCRDSRDTDAVIAEVHQLVSERTEAEEPGDQPAVFLTLIQVGRLRSLRREDDFASFGESEQTPDKQLEEILRDGPSVGVHTLIWAESYSTVNRWLSRSSLREIEIRLLMQMSANDSTNLVDSIAASRLGENVMLLFDEATGQEQRFRPFEFDTVSNLSTWIENT